jgi:hypothetical protein
VRVELGEVEAGLCACAELVGSAAVAVVGSAAVAVFTPAAGADLPPSELVGETKGREEERVALAVAALRLHCRATLPAPLIPNKLLRLGGGRSLPLTPTGKLDRQGLPAVIQELEDEVAVQAEASVSRAGAGSPGCTLSAMEALVAGSWQSILRLPRVPGPRADFFSLGGDSLLALRVCGALLARVRVCLAAAVCDH